MVKPRHPHSSSAPAEGNWRNPAIEAENRRYRTPPAVTTADSYAQRPRPRFAFLRRCLAILLAAVVLLLGASGSLAFWTQKNFVEKEGFSQISENMAHDQEFQHELAQAVTNDLMESEIITQYLGDGSSKNTFNPLDILGSLQDWGHDRVENLISGATTKVVEADNYPEVWQQVMTDTHDYNLDNSKSESVIDITAVYQEVDQQVGSIMGFDPDLVGSERHLINLDASNGTSLNQTFKSIRDFAATWQTQLIFAGIAVVLAFLIWPRGRLLFVGIVLLIAGALLWFGSLAAAGISRAAEALNITSSVGQVFIQGLANQYAHSLSEFTGAFVAPVLIGAAALIVLGIAAQIAGLSSRRTSTGASN